MLSNILTVYKFATTFSVYSNIFITSETLYPWANPTLSGSAMWGRSIPTRSYLGEVRAMANKQTHTPDLTTI